VTEKTAFNVGGLPELPEGWSYVPLEDLLEPNGISYGIVQPGNHDPAGIPIVRVKDLKPGRVDTEDPLRVSSAVEEKYSRTRLSGGEVLVSLVGSVGETAVAPSELSGWNVARAIGVLRVSDQVSASWLRICLSGDVAQHYMQSHLNTTVQATLNLRDLRRVPLVMPLKRERQAISDIIGALEKKISINERIAFTIDKLMRRLWDSCLREPGSREMTLFDAFDVTFGAPFKSSAFNSEGAGRPLLRIRDLKTFEPKVWTTQRLEKELVVAAGDVVAGMDAEFRPAFWLGDAALLNQRVMHIRSRIGGGSPLCREAIRKPLALVESYKTGTTVAHLNKSDLTALFVEIPNAEAVSFFESATAPLHERLVASAAETRTLAVLRETILPQLLSGKLRVPEAEKIVEDAV
jgi:type I restriction enzyme S subunit